MLPCVWWGGMPESVRDMRQFYGRAPLPMRRTGRFYCLVSMIRSIDL